MVFGEIPIAGRTYKTDTGIVTALYSFSSNRSVDFMLITGEHVQIGAVRASDDTPLTMNVQKFSHVGNKVTFHALAKHVELTFKAVPTVDRIAFYGEIPDSDTTIKQTFSAQEVNAARKGAAAAAGTKGRSKGKGPAKKPAATKKPKATVKVKPSKPSTTTTTESDPKKVKIKFPKGTKRGTVTHIDTTKTPPPAIPPGALVINAPRVPPLREDDEVPEPEDNANTIGNKKKDEKAKQL